MILNLRTIADRYSSHVCICLYERRVWILSRCHYQLRYLKDGQVHTTDKRVRSILRSGKRLEKPTMKIDWSTKLQRTRTMIEEQRNQAAGSMLKPYLLIERITMMERPPRLYQCLWESHKQKVHVIWRMSRLVSSSFMMLMMIEWLERRIIQMSHVLEEMEGIPQGQIDQICRVINAFLSAKLR